MERFRFMTPPFSREIKIEQRFRLDDVEAEVKALQEVVEARQSAALVAPAGAGKTVVLRALRAMLPEARHRVVYLKLANLSARDMCRQVALAMSVPPTGQYPSLVQAIEERFRSGYEEQGMRQVLIFDDAHEMRPEVVRLLRLLTNFEMDSRLVVSVILAGQMPLKARLLEADLEDIRQRLVHCAELRLLSRDDSKRYVDHRVKIVGAAKSPFADGAKESLFEVTRGNMRALDKLAMASLKAAAAAGRDTVEASDVAAARAAQWM